MMVFDAATQPSMPVISTRGSRGGVLSPTSGGVRYRVALLIDGTQERFNRAGADSIIELTFVSATIDRRSH